MSIITVDIRDIKLHFHIELSRRLNFVLGDSATGKTTFYDMLVQAINRGDETLTLRTNIGITFYTRNSDQNWGSFKDRLIIVDDFYILKDTAFLQLYNKAVQNNLWFLIMSREDIEDEFKTSIAFSTQSLYKMCCDGSDYFLAPLLDISASSFEDSKYDAVLIEDERAGFAFFKKLYCDKCKVFTSKGKGNIVRRLRDLVKIGYKNIFVIYDNASFGSCFLEFCHYCFRVDVNVSIMSTYECFEELLANTTLLRNLKEIGYDLPHLEEEANKFSSWERYFEYLVQMATENKPYRYRHKGKLRPCYIESCSKCSKQLQEKCDYANKADAKIEGLLRGTKYEGLLS